MTIGESLKRFRKSLGLSQKRLADSIGIACNAYQVWEYDKAAPSAKMLMKMADTYGVTTDYLLGRSDIPNPLGVDEGEMKEAFAARDILRQMQSLQLSMNRVGSRSVNAGAIAK